MAQQRKVVIIGPTASGKTSLIATVQNAAFQMPEPKARLFTDEDGNTESLWREVRDTILDGRFPHPATEEPRILGMRIEITVPKNQGFWGVFSNEKITDSISFSLFDNPGGVIFGDSSEEFTQFREQVIQEMKAATGIILCVDADREKSNPVIFYKYLIDLLTKVCGTSPLYGVDTLLVALTKAETQVENEGVNGLKIIEKSSAKFWGEQILTEPVMAAIKLYLPNARRAFAWSSNFGFDKNGVPNCKDGRLRHRVEADGDAADAHGDKAGDVINHWRPYQVIELFLHFFSPPVKAAHPLKYETF